MNYSIIQSSIEKFGEYEKEYMEIAKSVNISIRSLSSTNLDSAEKGIMWEGLFNQVSRVIEEIEFVVNKLSDVNFAEEEEILQEERDAVIQKYNGLKDSLQREKETISRQIEKKEDIIPVTFLQQRIPKKGYCYFCDIKIASGIPYQFSKEEQEFLEVKIIEGAGFCSRDCLLSHCKEYKKREETRQKGDKKIEERIESNKRLITQIHLAIGRLRNRINNLIKREKELKLDIDIFPSEEKVGFFRRIAQNLGLVKKESSFSDKLAEIKKKKARLGMEIKEKEKFLQQALLNLKVDEKHQKVRKASEKLFSKRNSIETKEKEEVDIDE